MFVKQHARARARAHTHTHTHIHTQEVVRRPGMHRTRQFLRAASTFHRSSLNDSVPIEPMSAAAAAVMAVAEVECTAHPSPSISAHTLQLHAHTKVHRANPILTDRHTQARVPVPRTHIRTHTHCLAQKHAALGNAVPPLRRTPYYV